MLVLFYAEILMNWNGFRSVDTGRLSRPTPQIYGPHIVKSNHCGSGRRSCHEYCPKRNRKHGRLTLRSHRDTNRNDLTGFVADALLDCFIFFRGSLLILCQLLAQLRLPCCTCTVVILSDRSYLLTCSENK